MSDRTSLPTASVIIPTYNRVGYLAEALDSIARQTIAAHQVVVVDDGSTDGTREHVTRIGPPVEYHLRDHGGISAARNYGLATATGEVIAWLDSDDLWEPEFLEATLGALAGDPPLDGVYTGRTFIDAAGNPIRSVAPTKPPEELYDALVEGNFLTTSGTVAWKRCYDAVGEFDVRLPIAEDCDMWLRLAGRYRIAGIPQPLVRYRVHAGNTVADMDAHTASRLVLTAKHFGDLADKVDENPPERRKAYAFTFRTAALLALESGKPDEAWRYLRRAVELYPPILERLDTYYELALADQPRGYRAVTPGLDIRSRGDALLPHLHPLLDETPGVTPALRHTGWGTAYLALGMLADQAGDWPLARGYLLQAASTDPALVRNASFLRRLAKVTAGKRLVSLARRPFARGPRAG